MTPRAWMSASARWISARASCSGCPFVKRHHQPFLPLYPFAIESMDLREYDLVISDSSAFAKGVVTRADALHICYCHTPMRWAWNFEEYVERERLGAFPV